MKTTTATDPEDKPITVTRYADLDKNASQIGLLLAISDQCSEFLVQAEKIGETVVIDEVAKTEARKTYEMAHTRLRDLIDEQRRWTLDASPHERESSDIIQSTVKLTDARRVNIETHNRPSVFLRPRIMRINDSEWCVWIGGDLPRRPDLHGIGFSPKEAMEAFDKAYADLQRYTPPEEAVPQPAAPQNPDITKILKFLRKPAKKKTPKKK